MLCFEGLLGLGTYDLSSLMCLQMTREVIILQLFPRPNVVVQASAKVHVYNLPPITCTSPWNGGDT